jgi:acyl carrier protein
MSQESQLKEICLDILQWIKQDRIEEELPSIELTTDSKLLEDEIFDSLKIMQFIGWLEIKYPVKVGVENMTADFFSSPEVVANNVVQLLQS